MVRRIRLEESIKLCSHINQNSFNTISAKTVKGVYMNFSTFLET